MARDTGLATDYAFAWRGILVAFASLPNVKVTVLGTGGRRNMEPIAVPEARVEVTLQNGTTSFYVTPGMDGQATVKPTSANSARKVKYEGVVGNVLSHAAKTEVANSMEKAREMKYEAEAKAQTELYSRTLLALKRLAAPLFYRGDPTHYGNVAFVPGNHPWGTYECRIDVVNGRVNLELVWDVNPKLLEMDPSYGDNAPVRVAIEEVIRTMLRCQQAYEAKFPKAETA